MVLLCRLRDGKRLALVLIDVGKALGVSTEVIFFKYGSTAGKTAGMWCEVNESINALKGLGDEDLMDVVYKLGSKIMLQAGVVDSSDQAIQIQKENIRSGGPKI